MPAAKRKGKWEGVHKVIKHALMTYYGNTNTRLCRSPYMCDAVGRTDLSVDNKQLYRDLWSAISNDSWLSLWEYLEHSVKLPIPAMESYPQSSHAQREVRYRIGKVFWSALAAKNRAKPLANLTELRRAGIQAVCKALREGKL